jgi:hypothetical protein
MALSDTLATVLSGTSIASILGAVAVVIRTRQQRRVSESDVVRRLSGTVGDLAEDVRRDARETIEDIRRSAERQIEWAGRRAEDAERRAVGAERSATEAQINAMQSAATVRRLTTAILSPYATIEGLRAMIAPESGGSPVNGKG